MCCFRTAEEPVEAAVRQGSRPRRSISEGTHPHSSPAVEALATLQDQDTEIRDLKTRSAPRHVAPFRAGASLSPRDNEILLARGLALPALDHADASRDTGRLVALSPMTVFRMQPSSPEHYEFEARSAARLARSACVRSGARCSSLRAGCSGSHSVMAIPRYPRACARLIRPVPSA